jgi:hypothetical protein
MLLSHTSTTSSLFGSCNEYNWPTTNFWGQRWFLNIPWSNNYMVLDYPREVDIYLAEKFTVVIEHPCSSLSPQKYASGLSEPLQYSPFLSIYIDVSQMASFHEASQPNYRLWISCFRHGCYISLPFHYLNCITLTVAYQMKNTNYEETSSCIFLLSPTSKCSPAHFMASLYTILPERETEFHTHTEQHVKLFHIFYLSGI